jgi:predicted hydrocarbon binding protein
MRLLLLAIQEVMGRSGLMTVLRQARLQRFSNRIPLYDAQLQINAAEYAAAMRAIENYYGRGARGTLLRVGQVFFRQLLAHHPVKARLHHLLYRVLPRRRQQRLVLRWLMQVFAAPDGKPQILSEGGALFVIDDHCDSSFGLRQDAPACWVTLGAIQEALRWATGHDYDVTEVACQATGDPVCRFEIGKSLG